MNRILSILLIFFSLTVHAQVNIAYLDLNAAIEQHPAIAAVQQEIAAYEQEQLKTLQADEEYLQSQIALYNMKKEAGYPQEELNKIGQTIGALQMEYQASINEIQKKLNDKRQNKLTPLYDSIDQYVAKISAKYDLDCLLQKINTEGVSVLLHGPESANLTGELVSMTGGQLTEFQQKIPAFSLDPKKVSIGYTNVELVLAYLPELKDIEDSMTSYTKALDDTIKSIDTRLGVMFTDYQAKEQAGTTPKPQMDTLLAIMQSMGYELKLLVDNRDLLIVNMRGQLLQPLLNKVQTAIDDVAKEQGFTYILNQTSSSGVSTIVHGPDNGDVTAYVFQKLGVEPDSILPLEVKRNIKVAYVNIEAVFASLPDTDSAKTKLNAFIAEQMMVLQPLEADLKTLQTRYSEMKAKGSATLPLVEKELIAKQQEYRLSSAQLEKEISELEASLLEPIQVKIQNKIDEIAKKEGYTYVLNMTSGLNILFNKEENLITKRVIDEISAN